MARLLVLVTLVAFALGRPYQACPGQHVLDQSPIDSVSGVEGADEVREECVFSVWFISLFHLSNRTRVAADVQPDTRKPRLKKAEIIPTGMDQAQDRSLAVEALQTNVDPVIDDFRPSLAVHVEWPSGKHASLGNTVNPEKLQDQPVIVLHDISKTSGTRTAGITYVVALTDPDAPSRNDPKWSEFCHWIVSATLEPFPRDSGGCHTHSRGLAILDEVMPYKPPGPPEKTGKHRYVFLAFVPSNGTTDRLHLSKPSGRRHWGYDTNEGETKGVREWAEENGLAPVAANFIYAKHRRQ
ncbi:Carboxypeptidase Y inhibitor [Madurella mycetomatis]|uniref:Carboxypeptidase Y inhibitor n=1 Tax=Madurella mycetomatis TaxID=100816 RepID=A0A175VQ55_9PEZI|nr:Carboxypeptidase Y inhibitor [Madurella mycetomatis]